MQNWAVTLTGELKPGIDAAVAWPRVAAVLDKDPATFEQQVLQRLPMTTHGTDEDAAMTRWQALDACGVKALLLPDDGKGLKVRLDGTVRGPVSMEFARRQLASRAWDGETEACADNSDDWMPLRELLQQASGNAAAVAATPATGSSSTARASEPRAVGDLPTNAEAPFLHAGFWRRAAAYLIDFCIIVLPLGLLDVMIFAPFHPDNRLKLNIFNLLLMWPYWAIIESSSWQATPGKRLMGLSVVDIQGQRIGFLRATGRFFAKLLSNMTLLIGYLLAAWTSRKQALHELVVSTCVVRNEG